MLQPVPSTSEDEPDVGQAMAALIRLRDYLALRHTVGAYLVADQLALDIRVTRTRTIRVVADGHPGDSGRLWWMRRDGDTLTPLAPAAEGADGLTDATALIMRERAS